MSYELEIQYFDYSRIPVSYNLVLTGEQMFTKLNYE